MRESESEKRERERERGKDWGEERERERERGGKIGGKREREREGEGERGGGESQVVAAVHKPSASCLFLSLTSRRSLVAILKQSDGRTFLVLCKDW